MVNFFLNIEPLSYLEQNSMKAPVGDRRGRDWLWFSFCCCIDYIIFQNHITITHVTEYCKQLLSQKILWIHIGYCCVDVIICNYYQIIIWKYRILCIINHVFSRNWHEGQSSCFEEMVWILPVSVLSVVRSLSIVSSISDTPSPIL